MSAQDTVIARHKTAIRRRDLSRPVKCALRDGLIGAGVRVFDYGCGHGEDVELLRGQGVACDGWDPVFRPATPHGEADVVNIGFVINVIEDPAERSVALRRAWQLCRRVLIVAAQLKVAGRGKSFVEFGDGIVTGRGTFQKLYEQAELKQYLESELGAEAIPAGLGVFYVFRDEGARQQLLASRYRRRSVAPQQRLSEALFETHRSLLEPFMTAVASLGRLPEADEYGDAPQLVELFGSTKRAFALVRRVTGSDEWDQIRCRRTEDLLVYLALARFRSRPPISKLPIGLQLDIRAFFGNYTKACRQADHLLFRAGNVEAIDEACRRSPVGKLLPNALYVHKSALESLESILRVYEGCGRAYLGEIEGANIVKIHRFSGKMSYLVYPDFETDPHPSLVRCVKLSMRTREIECYDYAGSKNPPILHRKETFVNADHSLHGKFLRLTRQEEKLGLLDNTATIGTRDGWAGRLRDAGFVVRGHRVLKLKQPFHTQAHETPEGR